MTRAKAMPKTKSVLDYEHFYGKKPPVDRLSIISELDKSHVLVEICALNNKLNPKKSTEIDTTLDTQKELLRYFTKTELLYHKYAALADSFLNRDDDSIVIFTRQMTLLALEEVVNSDELEDIDDFSMAPFWEKLLEYLLAVNYAFNKLGDESEPNQGDDILEVLNPKLIAFNELQIEINLHYTLYRGLKLITFFENSDLKTSIEEHFIDQYSVTANEFIYELANLYMKNSLKDERLEFYYYIGRNKIDAFEKLSKRYNNRNLYSLLSIRKSPFIKVSKQEFVLSDNTMLIEKSYSQLINDFWFDTIKQKQSKKYNIQFYRGFIGYFLEEYVTELFDECFGNYKYSKLLLFDGLKIDGIQGNIEIADIYLRNSNKILIGQVKSRNIYDDEKYGGSITSLYRNNKDQFFKDFGVHQIVKSIKDLEEYCLKIDSGYPKDHSRVVWPMILVHEKVLQTPLMANVFNDFFQEILKQEEISLIKKLKIMPLTLAHISDFENMEGVLSDEPKTIWSMLKHNHRDSRFVPPFLDSVNQYRGKSIFPERIRESFGNMINEYESVKSKK